MVDRIVVSNELEARLADSFETALELSNGLAVIEFADAGKQANKNIAPAVVSPNTLSHYAASHILFHQNLPAQFLVLQ